MSKKIFFDRRSGAERRSGRDLRRNPRLELPHRRRRRQPDRRAANRSTVDDFYALHGLNSEDLKPTGRMH